MKKRRLVKLAPLHPLHSHRPPKRTTVTFPHAVVGASGDHTMDSPEIVKLLQFRAAYNLPVHAGIETGIFARHALIVETEYTPGSVYINQALKEGRFDIGHTGADDIIAD